MSWLYSRALVVEYSEAHCSDGAQSAQSRLTSTPQAYCAPDKMTVFSGLSRFGMTFAALTGDLGEGQVPAVAAAAFRFLYNKVNNYE